MASDQCERSERIRLRRMRVAEEQRQAEFVANAMPSGSEVRCASKTEAVSLAKRLFAGWTHRGSLLTAPDGRRILLRTLLKEDRRLLVWGPAGRREPVLLWLDATGGRRFRGGPESYRSSRGTRKMADAIRTAGLGSTNGRGSVSAVVPEYHTPSAVPRVG